MRFLSGLKSLFSSNAKVQETIEYNGFIIAPTPMRNGMQFRIAATITKGEGESLQTHKFIRSDMFASHDECVAQTLRKAKIAIDQCKDTLFQ